MAEERFKERWKEVCGLETRAREYQDMHMKAVREYREKRRGLAGELAESFGFQIRQIFTDGEERFVVGAFDIWDDWQTDELLGIEVNLLRITKKGTLAQNSAGRAEFIVNLDGEILRDRHTRRGSVNWQNTGESFVPPETE